MKPRISAIAAAALIVIAGAIAIWNRSQDPRPADSEEPTEAKPTRPPDRDDGSPPEATPSSPRAELPPADEAPLIAARDAMTAQWVERAGTGFQQTRQNLVTDLELSPDQGKALEQVFARRENDLAKLLGLMNSEQAEDDPDLMKKICALIRNKDLRDDLVGVLTKEQLDAYDARETKRRQDTVEARAYRDLAEINALVSLTEAQKPEVFGVLSEQAAAKVEQEADARAFMSLTYGPLASTMDPSLVRGLSNLMSTEPGQGPDFQYGSAEHQQWMREQKQERVENEVSALREVLTEDQLARYRESLEAQAVW